MFQLLQNKSKQESPRIFPKISAINSSKESKYSTAARKSKPRLCPKNSATQNKNNKGKPSRTITKKEKFYPIKIQPSLVTQFNHQFVVPAKGNKYNIPQSQISQNRINCFPKTKASNRMNYLHRMLKLPKLRTRIRENDEGPTEKWIYGINGSNSLKFFKPTKGYM